MASAKPNKKLLCKDLYNYLKGLPTEVLNRLYTHPATCLAVFRELPILARHYVMRVLFVEQPVPQTCIGSWVEAEHHSDHKTSCEVLHNLRVWHEAQIPGGLSGWILNETFRENLKVALLGGGKPWTGSVEMEADKYAKDIPALDKYAMERWECVLHFMVGSRESVAGVSRDVVDILVHADLMSDESATGPMITTNGFQFLLMDTAAQVWFFMLQYLDTVQSRDMDLVECLSFLFQLSFSSLGKDYSTEGMTESQSKLLQHLREFGLVYQRKRKSQRFYPTRLAISLASGIASSSSDIHRPGYIVIETNYRIYAYTDSSLQVALLGLFCDMLYRFPNLSVGQLTRDSVRQALISGITAEQILNFLHSHAHPEMLQKTPVIPPTISDQVRLWELERDRFRFNDGVLYNQFLSQNDFELLRDYARDLGVLIWENPRSRMMVVTRGGHDDVKRFWKRQKNS